MSSSTATTTTPTTTQQIPNWHMKADYVEHVTVILDVLVTLLAFQPMVSVGN
jgi:hypothetical protein